MKTKKYVIGTAGTHNKSNLTHFYYEVGLSDKKYYSIGGAYWKLLRGLTRFYTHRTLIKYES